MFILSVVNFLKTLGIKNFILAFALVSVTVGALIFYNNIQTKLQDLETAKITISNQETVIKNLTKEMTLLKESNKVTNELLTTMRTEKTTFVGKTEKSKTVVKTKIQKINNSNITVNEKANQKSTVYIEDLYAVYIDACATTCGEVK